MWVYLPIAEMPVNALVIILASAAVGFISGLVGVGGGFIMTPAMIFMGIPPAVAVATEASQITATSFSGALTYWRRRLIDLRMALLLSMGGIVGSVIGVQIFASVKRMGQIELLIAVSYLIFLGVIGGLMMWESVRALRRKAKGLPARRPKRRRTLLHALPLRMRFPASGLYLSVLPPLALGAAVGVLAAIMGVGGGFLLVPAMIYLLRMPTQVVVGTSLVQVLVVTAFVTLLQSVQTKTVDLILAALLIVGGVVGAQLGARAGVKFSAERLRAILGFVLLATGLKLFFDAVSTPAEAFTFKPML
jgi:hypothetical protein